MRLSSTVSKVLVTMDVNVPTTIKHEQDEMKNTIMVPVRLRAADTDIRGQCEREQVGARSRC